ncbi:MAG: hypothetical protein KatS3mg031_0159 [Chitinophagales bacterium]|nr:MAG: hypothetical protein KatS3mg031_0159 [Chitinophagales bacterium]
MTLQKAICISAAVLICLVILPLRAQKLPTDIAEKMKLATDSAEVMSLYVQAGNTHYTASDFLNAADCYFHALRIAEKKQWEEKAASLLNNIAICYLETEKFEEAEKHAARAVEIFTRLNSPAGLGDAYNTLGNIYYLQAIDSVALPYYMKSLHYRKAAGDTAGLFATLKNLGGLYFETGDTLNSIHFMLESLNYLRPADDSIRWFSAYMTLGELYTYMGQLERGKYYLDKAAPYKPTIGGYHKLDDYHYALYYYYKAEGNPAQALAEYQKYVEYKDSLVNIEKNRQILELNTRYETEKKETQIKQQQIQLENEQKTRMLYTALFISILLLTAMGFIVLYQRQKRQTELKLREQHDKSVREIFRAEQNERIRIARDLHDSIGQKLAVMRMILPKAEGNKELEKVSAYLEETANEVRNISHNLIPEILNFGLAKAIENLADRINSTEQLKVTFTLDEQLHKISLPKQSELSLYRIIQEILSNIIRHAQTDTVNIHLGADDKFVQLVIEDKGHGFDTRAIDESKGLGWKNIFARIKLINGNIKIQSEKNKGSTFVINIPIA